MYLRDNMRLKIFYIIYQHYINFCIILNFQLACFRTIEVTNNIRNYFEQK